MSSSLVSSNPAPVHTLRRLLATRRRAGVSFDDAWAECLRGTLKSVPAPAERDAWLLALRATRSAWEAGYRREGPPLRLVLLDD